MRELYNDNGETPYFTGEWKHTRLENVVDVLDNRRIPLSESMRKRGPYPYCGANGIVDYIDSYIFDESVLLIAEDGGNFADYATRPIAYRMSGKFWVNNHAHILKSKNGINQDFIYYTLAHKDITEVVAGGTRSKLTRSQLNLIRILLPPSLSEQRAIAKVLGDVDKLIENLEKRLAKKRAIKQGAMQELLTGKKRLPGFSGEWGKVTLGEIGVLYGGLSGKTAADFGHGEAKFITFLNVLTNIVIDIQQVGMVNVQLNEKQNNVQKGDIFFNISSETPEEVAMCAALLEDVHNVYLNSFCCGFRLKSASNDPLFMSYFFNSGEGRKSVRNSAQGLTRYNLSKKTFLSSVMNWPVLQEQRAIAKVLSDMDDEISVLERKLEKVKQVKQGMMQDLLTGKVRLRGQA